MLCPARVGMEETARVAVFAATLVGLAYGIFSAFDAPPRKRYRRFLSGLIFGACWMLLAFGAASWVYALLGGTMWGVLPAAIAFLAVSLALFRVASVMRLPDGKEARPPRR